MTLTREMLATFGKKNLVYANPERLAQINLPNQTKKFILSTGFPRVVNCFRFSMDFESVSEDTRIGKSIPNFHQAFTIGCKGINRLINTLVSLNEINLDDNASLSDIDRKLETLGIPDDPVFSVEVQFAHRVCIDLLNNAQIVSINPESLSVTFLNSSIQHLAASVIANEQCFNLKENLCARAEKFKSKMLKIDPEALKNPQNIWSLMIEECKLQDEDDYEHQFS